MFRLNIMNNKHMLIWKLCLNKYQTTKRYCWQEGKLVGQDQYLPLVTIKGHVYATYILVSETVNLSLLK